MKTYIVFGANGFIGASIVEELSQLDKVIAVDRFSRKESFNKNSNLTLVKADVSTEKNLEKLFDKKIDGVIWSVGGVVPADTLNNEEILNLIQPTIKLLKTAFEKKIPIILISSAGMLYKPQTRTLTENSVIEPWTWYGLQKLILESSLSLLSNEFNNKDFTIFRVSSVYGERQPTEKSQGVVGKLIKSAIKQTEFVMYGSGNSKRDYIYVKDLAKIVKLSIEKPLKYKTYNVSSGKLYTLEDLKKIIENVSGKKITIAKEDKRSIDPVSIAVSNRRLMKELKNFKFTTMEYGIKQTYIWFERNI